MMEPRGHSCMSGALYTEPCNPDADMGILYFDACNYMEMCGHSTIAVATVLVETGMVKVTGQTASVKLDTPAGLVTANVKVSSFGVEQVSFQNVPSFLYGSKEIDIHPFGKIMVHVSFGGMAYAIVNAKDIGIRVNTHNAAELSGIAHVIHKAAQREIGFVHPYKPFIDRIHSVMIVDEPVAEGAHCKEVVVCIPAEEGNSTAIDRSPCGTGTSARIAAEFALGKAALGQPLVHESIIGTCFTGRIIEKAKVGSFEGGIPEITGSAYLTASGEFILDPRDSVQDGFIVG